MVIATAEIQFSIICSDLRFRLGAVGGKPYASADKRRFEHGSRNKMNVWRQAKSTRNFQIPEQSASFYIGKVWNNPGTIGLA
jgi:hypothetical protein